MREIAEFVAVLACGLFAGAAIYLSLVEHPARMECGVQIEATEFAPSYRRATILQDWSCPLTAALRAAAQGDTGKAARYIKLSLQRDVAVFALGALDAFVGEHP